MGNRAYGMTVNPLNLDMSHTIGNGWHDLHPNRTAFHIAQQDLCYRHCVEGDATK